MGKQVLKWHKQTSTGKPVALPVTGYKWNQQESSLSGLSWRVLSIQFKSHPEKF
ncbi:ClbS/DfsB family four-helix bundle protein [Microbulbifer spongiae]|uniref:ClbS/DfsB family four-helix bundle protein n=1 Tax=Microbulbifer spongiae TaxID=2944933 RepID=UPI00345EC4F2